ncbi:hypothetical protein ACFLVW_06105 [Chloroflexota bacterium]
MAKNKQDKDDGWEREHVQRVLDYHNKKYGTHIAICGKTQDVRPDLKGKSDWDWVCYDTGTQEEIAVEVKRITDSRLEEKSNMMWQLLEDVRDSLSGKLPGTFFLSINIPQDYYPPFNKQANKQEFKRVLYDAVYKTAQKLKLGKTEDLEPQIKKQLPFALPDISPIDLHKFSDEGNTLYKGSGSIGWGSISFDSSELEEFEKIVAKANEQLREANMKETFLVLIEEGHRPKDPPEVADALKNINRDSYSEIRQVYFIRGDEVAEIPLPTN